MNPDERFRGRVEGGYPGIPWQWAVYDLKKDVKISWGEEFYQPVAMRECAQATAGARWWHWYKRT